MVIIDLERDGNYIQHLSDDLNVVITPAVAYRAKLEFKTWNTENIQLQCSVIIGELIRKVNNVFWVGEINRRVVENLIIIIIIITQPALQWCKLKKCDIADGNLKNKSRPKEFLMCYKG